MTYVRAIRDGEMADKAGAFLVKSFEVIGNRRGGTKERKEKRIENGNEIRGGGGEERRGVSCSVATTLARLLFIGPRKGKTNTDCKPGEVFLSVSFLVSARTREKGSVLLFDPLRDVGGTAMKREREREGRKRRKERARSNYRHLVENGILRMEDVEIGRQMNRGCGGPIVWVCPTTCTHA